MADDPLRPYVPRLVVDWLRHRPQDRWQAVEGSLAFVDISGFTALTEKLARKGKVGAEEMSDLLNATFAGLLAVAYDDGAGLVKWGGDAVLLLYDGPEHAERAVRASVRMRAALRETGRLVTDQGRVQLRMSVGVHSGEFHFFLVGDPALHRELIVSGPAASTCAVMEATAEAGEVVVSAATAALLAPAVLGPAKDDGYLVRREPQGRPPGIAPAKVTEGLDLGSVLSEPIRTHLRAGGGEPEHRTIAVGFVQFSGTDQVLAEDGPDALAAALEHAMGVVERACADNGVTFFETDINADGGKVMLTSGAPVSHGHDEERLLRAGRAIVEGAGRLPMRVGVNRGPVFSGDFGPPFRRTYSVKGDAINLAARVMGKALPGELLATQAVLDRARTTFALTPREPFMVKGKSEPVHASVVGPPQEVEPAEAEPAATPLVGRDREVARLEELLADARQGRGHVAHVVGGAGTGKSRLVAEVRARAEGFTRLGAVGDEYASTVPYALARRLLRGLIGVTSASPPDEVAKRLGDVVTDRAPHLTPWLPLVGVVMNLDLPATPETEALAEEFRQERLDEVVAELLAAAVAGPLLMTVEDAHMADDASASIFARLARETPDRPWLLLASAAPEGGGFEPEPGSTDVVRLGPLDDEAVASYLLVLADDDPLPPVVIETLARRAQGNPLFAEALLYSYRQSHSLSELPDSVDGVVKTEIDRLPPERRRVLRYAAVLGERVDESLLRELVDLPPGRRWVRPLAAFLVSDGPGWWRFRNGLIRDVAYDGLPFRRRKELHETVGVALEAALPDPATSPEPLALHFHRAGRHDKAWRYARLAGQRSLARYAHGDATDYLRWAIESGTKTGASQDDVRDLLEQLSDALFFTGHTDDALLANQAALRLAQDDQLAAALLLKRARATHRMGRSSLTLRHVTTALRRIEALDGHEAARLRSHLYARAAYTRLGQGRYRQAVGQAELAMAEANRSEDWEAQSQALLTLLSVVLWSGGPAGEAEEYGRRSLDLCREHSDLVGEAHTLNDLAVSAVFTGEWRTALERLDAAADLFRRIGDVGSLAAALYNRGDILVRLQRPDRAIPPLREALRLARGVGDEDTVALVQRELGKALWQQGHATQAEAPLREAWDRLVGLGAGQEALDAELALALVTGDLDRTALTDLLDRASAVGADTLRPTLQRLLAVARVDEGDASAAVAAAREGRELARRDGLLQHEVVQLSLLLAALVPEEAEAAQLRQEAEDLAERLGMPVAT